MNLTWISDPQCPVQSITSENWFKECRNSYCMWVHSPPPQMSSRILWAMLDMAHRLSQNFSATHMSMKGALRARSLPRHQCLHSQTLNSGKTLFEYSACFVLTGWDSRISVNLHVAVHVSFHELVVGPCTHDSVLRDNRMPMVTGYRCSCTDLIYYFLRAIAIVATWSENFQPS